ncbi:MAG: Ig-like domain-containing protein [Myxococcota bacterium]
MNRLRALLGVVTTCGCLYLPSEQYACKTDADCAPVGGACDLASETCVVGQVTDADGGLPAGSTSSSSSSGGSTSSGGTTSTSSGAPGSTSSSGQPGSSTSSSGSATSTGGTSSSSGGTSSSSGSGTSSASGATSSSSGATSSSGTSSSSSGSASAPQMLGETVQIVEDTAVVVDVLANDYDPDGTALSLFDVVPLGAQEGSVVVVGTLLRVVPAPNRTAPLTVSYTAVDGEGLQGSATLTINITPVNDPPSLSVTVNPPASGTVVTGQLTAVDPEGGSVSYVVEQNPAGGSVDINGNTFTYTSSGMVMGNDHFLVYAQDGLNARSESVRVEVALPVTLGGVTITWQGDSGSSPRAWENGDNWDLGRVPLTDDRVLIPANASIPQLGAATTVSAILVEDGGSLEVNADLTVSGEAYAPGGITGTGRVVLNNDSPLLGTFPALRISGIARVVGSATVARDVTVTTGSAVLDVDAGHLLVGGDFSVTNSGLLRMKKRTGWLEIGGNASFGGADTRNELTAGVLELRGDLSVSSYYHLTASGSHFVIFSNRNQTIQSVTIGNPESNALQHVRVANDAGINLATTLLASGDFSVETPVVVDGWDAGLVVDGNIRTARGSTLRVRVVELYGAVSTSGMVGVLDTETLRLQNTSVVSPGQVYTTVEPHDDTTVADGAVMDNLDIRGGVTSFPGRATIRGDFSTQGNGSGFAQQDANSYVLVLGDASLRGSTSPTTLNAGTLEVHGNITVEQSGIAASGTHQTWLNGDVMQAVDWASYPELGHLNNVLITNPAGVNFASTVYIDGTLEVPYACPLTGANGKNVTVRKDITTADGTEMGMATLYVGGGAGTTLMGTTTVMPLVLVLSGDAQALNTQLTYRTLRIIGADAVLPEGLQMTGDLIVNSGGTADLTGNVDVPGNVTVDGSGSRLRVNDHSLRTTDLTVSNNAALVMDAGNPQVLVRGNVTWLSNSEGTLRAGVLEVRGNFSSGNYNFRASSAHTVKFSGGNQSVDMQPSTHFWDVVVEGGAVTLTTAVTVSNTVTIGPGSLTVNAGNTLTVSGGLTVESDGTFTVNGNFQGTCTAAAGATTNADCASP